MDRRKGRMDRRFNEIGRRGGTSSGEEGRGRSLDAERERLRELGVTLGRCWDLLTSDALVGAPSGGSP